MPLPKVNIAIANGQLGRVAAVDDSVAGLLISGYETEKLSLNEPVQVFSFDQLIDHDITEANNEAVYKDVKAFYDQAGEGAELWLMIVGHLLLLEDLCDETQNYAKKLLDAASGRIRLLGINRVLDDEYVGERSEGIWAEVWNGLSKLDTMAIHYAQAYKPFRALLPGLGFSQDYVSSLRDLKEGSNNRVSIVLGTDTSLVGDKGGIAIGLTLGRLASIPVQRNIARVKDGDVGLTAAYFPDGTPTADLESYWDSIHDKGYIFFRRIYGKYGFFFTDDPTATGATDDFSSLARGRVIDKAQQIAYLTFVEELNEEIPVNPDTGMVAPALIASWKTNIEQALGINMTAKKEIVKAECFIDPNQNVLATDTLYAVIKVLPVGYAKLIEITLGLSNPYKSSE